MFDKQSIGVHSSCVATKKSPELTAEDEQLMRRAYAAYYRSGATQQPGGASSGVERVGGLKYVVLRDSDGVLGVYRVRHDGVLKGLKRWPAELDPK